MAYEIPPLINGKEYEYADITAIVLGVPLVGITAIEYGEEADTKNIYATGRYPVSRSHGQITPKASLTVLMSDLMPILAAIPDGKLFNVPEFDVIVTFTDANLVPVIHTIKNCRFKANVITTQTGDTSIPVKLDLEISNIVWKP